MEFDLKVETDNITSTYIAASQVGWAVILVIMYLEAFQNWRYCFIGINVIMWRHTDLYFPGSESPSWYWQNRSVRSKDKCLNYR